MLDRVLGPRVSREEAATRLAAHRLPTILFSVAAGLLVISILLPYWHLHLQAPQFPDGLDLHAYVNRLEGDVVELEGLNHYVGLDSFEDGAVFERSVAVAAILGIAGLLAAAIVIHSRWVVVFTAPAVLFPLVFVADLQWWLWRYGHNLDSAAPFADAVGEFTPPIFGPAEIAQFDTMALPGLGLILATVAAAVTVYGLVRHRRVYKPLVDAANGESA
ncbi:MAG: cytochrome C [Acidimicrobiia bacterium]|nr:cytochrome C [Acidimicrobiia bacterium]